MSKLFSQLIAWGSIAIIVLIVATLFTFLIDISWFAAMAKSNLRIPINWATVEQWQWYLLWTLTMAYLATGLIGLFFLHRAFKKIASGELFNLTNSLNIRRFAVWLFVQAAAKPVTYALASVTLSLNHPQGEKLFSLSFGTQELSMLAIAMIFWVVSDVLVVGCRLQSENRQFV